MFIIFMCIEVFLIIVFFMVKFILISFVDFFGNVCRIFDIVMFKL